MTDTDLRAQIAATRASLDYIQKAQDDAKADHKAAAKLMAELAVRVERIETRIEPVLSLPMRVQENTTEGRVQMAIDKERHQSAAATRSTLALIAAIAGAAGGGVAAIVGAVVWLMQATGG